LVKKTIYKKRFALFPIRCSDGTRVWFKPYYKKYHHWDHEALPENPIEYGHTEFVETIAEDEYLVRKLAETL
jgi:hypothetical protein